MVKPWDSASSRRRSRFSRESVKPAGFWKLGMTWASVGATPPSSRVASASVSMPSVCSSTACSVGAAVAQVQQGAVVGGPLDDDGVPALYERLEQEGVGLHGAVGDEHPLRLDAVALGDPLTQRGVADRRAVRRHAAGVVAERALR